MTSMSVDADGLSAYVLNCQNSNDIANPVPNVRRGPNARKIDNSPRPYSDDSLIGLAV